MNPASWAAIVVAIIAVLGMIASVVALTFRVGRLVGTVESGNRSSEGDRQRLWQELGMTNGRIERHIEVMHAGANHRGPGR